MRISKHGLQNSIRTALNGDGDSQEFAREAAPRRETPQWPAPLREESLIGPAGEFVRIVSPHTEADDAAILLQFLAGMGIVMDRSAYFAVEADKHHGNLFVVIVGESSKARKGTSWGHVCRVLEQVDATIQGRIAEGLASGEGLIWYVRDGKNDDDAGEADKRLLVVESEFSRPLSVSEREGNTLSAVIRQAWDRGRLQTMPKKDAATATGAHIGLIGHITVDELHRLLSATAAANGFANRFLWTCARRSKLLPRGGRVEEDVLHAFIERLKPIVEQAKKAGIVDFDAVALSIWEKEYARLTAPQDGLFGKVTSRGEAQVIRLSLLFSLLDRSPIIREAHLRAALAVWDYCRDSARFIFGDAIGDSTADSLRDLIRAAGDTGVTRTEMRAHFKGHRNSAETDRALAVLERRGEAYQVIEPTLGRPTERWFFSAQ